MLNKAVQVFDFLKTFNHIIPNPTIKVAPKHEQLTTEFFVAV